MLRTDGPGLAPASALLSDGSPDSAFLFGAVVRGARRVSPRRATHFSCFAKKSKQKKASRIRRPAARAHCDARRSRGRAKLASLKQTPALIRLRLRFSSPNNGAVRTAKHPTSEYRKPMPQSTSTRHGAYLFGPCLLNFGCRVSGNSGFGCLAVRTSPWGRAEQRSSGRIRAGVCLSPQGEFSPTPIDASSARNRAAALSSARLFFGDFLLAKQKKVTALSGAHPDDAKITKTISDKRCREHIPTKPRCPENSIKGHYAVERNLQRTRVKNPESKQITL